MHTVVCAKRVRVERNAPTPVRIRICRVEAHARTHRESARARIARGSNQRARGVGGRARRSRARHDNRRIGGELERA